MDTLEKALQVLNDEHATEEQRTQAAHFLGHNKTPEAAEALVAALDDDDYGVHWAASEGLATIGDPALPPLLHALVRPDCSSRIIHGAKHAFHNSTSAMVKAETKTLLKAMHGSGQTIEIMQAASNLMMKLKIR